MGHVDWKGEGREGFLCVAAGLNLDGVSGVSIGRLKEGSAIETAKVLARIYDTKFRRSEGSFRTRWRGQR